MSVQRGGVLVVDVGTSGVRAAIVRPDSVVEHTHHRAVLPDSPAPGLVEFDAALMAEAVLADGGRFSKLISSSPRRKRPSCWSAGAAWKKLQSKSSA